MTLNVENVFKTYGDRQILDGVTFYLQPGDKLGVVGVNGCGKSTLLKIAAGAEQPDDGSVSTDPNTRIAYLSQSPVYDSEQTVLDYVISGQPENTRDIAIYEAERILTILGMTTFDERMGALSGGQRKRAALAQCLTCEADLLVLDEPTNHLDVEMINWLENYLESYTGAVLFVSHDRYFLERLATRTAEITYGRFFVYPGGYSAWLDGKARREEMEAASERKRQATLRRELVWVLQGPCARGTKSRERLERYAALKAQLPPQTDGEIEAVGMIASRLGKKTIELAGVTKAFNGRQIIAPFDFLLLRDDRVGIVGLNGSGKTTLLNLIAGRLTPDSGTVTVGDTVRIGYFSQHAEELDGTMTAIEYVRECGDRIETAEGFMSASKLMELFLFPGTLQHRKIGQLSGGEKRRLFLLGILAKSPNVLLLDEPTNDLDIPTLQVLENYLMNFTGAVIAVSHDRYFLDRICKRTFVSVPGQPIRMFNGGFSDCSAYLFEATAEPRPVKKAPAAPKPAAPERTPKLRFSFKEQREYDTIEDDIAALEAQLAAVEAEQAENCSDYVLLQQLGEQQAALEAELEAKLDRWTYLSELAEKIAAQNSK